MGVEEFGKLLKGVVEDGDVAARVADGDFADLEEGDLTEAERSLMRAAAGEIIEDDVVGFSKVEFEYFKHYKVGGFDFGDRPKLERAVKYFSKIEFEY